MIRSTFYGFSTALSGLKASQTALDVIGQNVSNANTEGYSRQRVIQTSVAVNNTAEKYGSSSSPITGEGTQISSLEQVRDTTLDTQFRNENASVGYYDAELGSMEAIESIFDEATTSGMRDSILAIQTAFENLSLNTGSDEFDALVRSSSESTCKLFNQYDKQLKDAYDAEVYEFENGSVADANSLLQDIATINKTIKSAEVSGGNPLELYDQRNNMLDELSSYFDMEYSLEKVTMAPEIYTNVLHVYMKDAAGGKIELIDGEQYAQLGVTQVESTDYYAVQQTDGTTTTNATYDGKQLYMYTDENGDDHYGTLSDEESGGSVQVFTEISQIEAARAATNASSTTSNVDALKDFYSKYKVDTSKNSIVKSAVDDTSIRDNYTKLYVSALTKSGDMSYDDIVDESKRTVSITVTGADYAKLRDASGNEVKTGDDRNIYVKLDKDGNATEHYALMSVDGGDDVNNRFEEYSYYPAAGVTPAKGTAADDADTTGSLEIVKTIEIQDGNGDPLQFTDTDGVKKTIVSLTNSVGVTSYGTVTKNAGTDGYSFTELTDEQKSIIANNGIDIDASTNKTADYKVFTSGMDPIDITPTYGSAEENKTSVTNGILKGTLDMLNCAGDFEEGGDTIRGFKYYAGALDTLASEMATKMNVQNRIPVFQNDGTGMYESVDVKNIKNVKDSSGNIVSDLYARYADDGSIAEYGKVSIDDNGNKEFTAISDTTVLSGYTVTDGTNTYNLSEGADAADLIESEYDENELFARATGEIDGITAGNISTSKGWQEGKTQVVNGSSFCYEGDNVDGDNSNTLKFVKMFEDDTDFNTTSGITMFTGGFENFLSAIGDQVALDVSTENTTYTSHNTVLSTVDNNRMSVSGVSIDEEAVDIYKFQRAYQASSRLMTALDECLEKLINSTGRVGL